MKLASDALIAIIGTFRKGLMEDVDISELLKELSLVERDGKLSLDPHQKDIWTVG